MSTPESQPPGQPTPDPAPNPTPADGGESRQLLFLEPLTALPNETAKEFAERALDQIKRNLWLRLRTEGRIPRSPPPEEGPPEGG